MRYKKHYTVREWKRFDRVAERENGNDVTAQEIMLQKYEIILTDYKTRKERVIEILKKFNFENLDKGITKFNKGVNEFVKTVDSKKR